MINSFWGDIFKFKKKSNTIDTLRHIPIFKGLSHFDLIKVSKLLHLRKYKKGEVIFHQNEPGESMFIIQAGKVDIQRKTDFGTTTLASLSDGSFFGEISLVDEETRTATAISKEDSSLLGFFRADLIHLIDRNPRLASFILLHLSMVLGKRLRLLDSQLQSNHEPITQ